MSRQFEHLQRKSLEFLRSRIPAGAPITIERISDPLFHGFEVRDRGEILIRSKYHVIAAFLEGYATGRRSVRVHVMQGLTPEYFLDQD